MKPDKSTNAASKTARVRTWKKESFTAVTAKLTAALEFPYVNKLTSVITIFFQPLWTRVFAVDGSSKLPEQSSETPLQVAKEIQSNNQILSNWKSWRWAIFKFRKTRNAALFCRQKNGKFSLFKTTCLRLCVEIKIFLRVNVEVFRTYIMSENVPMVS